MQRVAIIGAGLAGAVLTERLVAAGLDVSIFEKSRGTGGRLASSRLGEYAGDLGAPFIDSHSEAFTAWLANQQQLGRVARWLPRAIDFGGDKRASEQYWVGVGRNSSLTRALIEGAKLHAETRIGTVWPDKEGVLLRDVHSESLGHYDAVVCTAPAPQAVPLLEAIPRFSHLADEAVTDPAWVYLAAVSELPDRLRGVDLVEGQHAAIGRIVVDSNKPGRRGAVIKVEMSRDWSEANVELHADTVKSESRKHLQNWLGETLDIQSDRIHRWLYNRSYQPSPTTPALWDAGTGIGACGDWIGASGLDGSFNSANYLADLLLSSGQSAA